jgi:hypothetical protein
MSEDVVEFGASPARDPRPIRLKRRQFQLPRFSPPAIGAAGFALAGAAIILDWQETKISGRAVDGSDAQDEVYGLLDLGLTTLLYVPMLAVAVILAAMVLFGDRAGPRNLRIAALATAGLTAVLAVNVTQTLAEDTLYGGTIRSSAGVEVTLSAGAWAGLAAPILLGLAVLLDQVRMPAPEPVPAYAGATVTEPGEYDDVDELVVTIEPASPAVSPSHELYMRK